MSDQPQELNPVAQAEEKILKFWRERDIFAKSLAQRESAPHYVFYDGPPFATGTPHYGHILASAIKDAVPRYQTMRGKYVARRWGWDTHGLPIENIVEKKLGISGRKEIEQIGIEVFNRTAREQVLTYVDEWKKTVERMARWVDFDGSYKTMDDDYIESVWWAFGQLYGRGLIYEGTRVLPYCPRCETPIAQSEIAMDNSYKDIRDLSVYVQVELIDQPGTYLVLWTTTPWTLPADTAAAVNPTLEYATVEHGGSRYIAVANRVKAIFGDDAKVVATQPGGELVGLQFKPLFDYFVDTDLEHRDRGWQVYPADYVTDDMGSGIVHLAPAYGEIDMELAKEHHIPYVVHVGPDGRFLPVVRDFAGLLVKPKDDHQQTDIAIIRYLAEHNLLLKKEKIVHSYPHCFRCETPLYYAAIPAWFIAIQQCKDRMAELNEEIDWVPDHLKHGRFLKSMQAAPDWNISRNRYWASPLPIWKCANGHVTAVNSRSHLKELGGEVPNDLHRPYIDAVHFPCPECQGETTRIPEVFDCWFESASMPFAANHYPFENTDQFANNFPSDFVAEYIAQTRTWFYYMHVLAVILFDREPFRHVVTTGNILAEDGKKMSKRLQNYPDPTYIVDRYGADALRYYLLASPVMRAQDINFSELGVDEVFKKVVLRLRNVMSFYELHPDRGETVAAPRSSDVLDRWIVSRLAELRAQMTDAMERYELDAALRPADQFIDDLSTWYVRRSRDRMRSADSAASETLRYVLYELGKLIAPFMPFVAETLYQTTRCHDDPESVHLADWPDELPVDQVILDQMAQVRELVSLGLEVRASASIRVRQPLASATVHGTQLEGEYTDLLRDELNVRTIQQGSGKELAVEIDTAITPELKREGQVREVIRAVQQLRKQLGLSLDERAQLSVTGEGSATVLAAKTDIESTTRSAIVDSVDGGVEAEVEGIRLRLAK
ncbi:isoleucine--tRNA ligase [Candidatus Berkelbacteria bacterium]|nr:isoleucine--tRNA ligase [Candidatus Berkelbacteria bacterium]